MAANGFVFALMSVVVGAVATMGAGKLFCAPGVKLAPVILKGCTFAAFMAGADIIYYDGMKVLVADCILDCCMKTTGFEGFTYGKLALTPFGPSVKI